MVNGEERQVPGEYPLTDAEDAMQLYWESVADDEAARMAQDEETESEREAFDA